MTPIDFNSNSIESSNSFLFIISLWVHDFFVWKFPRMIFANSVKGWIMNIMVEWFDEPDTFPFIIIEVIKYSETKSTQVNSFWQSEKPSGTTLRVSKLMWYTKHSGLHGSDAVAVFVAFFRRMAHYWNMRICIRVILRPHHDQFLVDEIISWIDWTTFTSRR